MDQLESELKNISNLKEINKNLFNNINNELEKKQLSIFDQINKLSSSDLPMCVIKDLGKLLNHIITIINTDEVIGWIIELLHDDPESNADYDRGRYSININCYTIHEYDHIGFRYNFTFKTKDPKIKEIIYKVINEKPKQLSLTEQSWSMFLYGPDLKEKYKLKINNEYLKLITT